MEKREKSLLHSGASVRIVGTKGNLCRWLSKVGGKISVNIVKMLTVGADEGQSSLACTACAKQIRTVSKIARGSVMSAREQTP